jgi:hypothetical protein
MLARFAGITGHGIAVDAHQPFGLADPAALGDVLQDRSGLFPGQVGMEQGCALAFGKPIATGATAEEADRVFLAIVAADGEVFPPSDAMIGTRGIQAAEPREVIHDLPPVTYLGDRTTGCDSLSG